MRVWGRLGPVLLTGACACSLYVGVALAGAQFNNNFHAIVAGEAYRSAQPSAETIATYSRTYGIKSIINLRGDGGGAGWYKAEVTQSKALGIAHFDFPMSAHRALGAEDVTRLVALMRSAPKPLLIHCKAGADRTGLASALYLAAAAGASEETSEGQLTLDYGHIALPVLGTWEMNRSLEDAEPALGFLGS